MHSSQTSPAIGRQQASLYISSRLAGKQAVPRVNNIPRADTVQSLPMVPSIGVRAEARLPSVSVRWHEAWIAAAEWRELDALQDSTNGA